MPATRRRAVRQGITLSLVFGGVLMSGAATGAWVEPMPSSRAVSSDLAAAGGGPAGWPGGQDPTGARLSPQQAERLVDDGDDRWAAYYSPQEYTALTEGRYLGVGLTVERVQDGTTAVAGVQPGSPAQQAGIVPGATLLGVDGVSPEGLAITEVVARLRGLPGDRTIGSAVRLDLREQGRARRVVLHRVVLDAAQVDVGHPAPGVVEVAVHAFTSGVAQQVRAAVGGARGVVLDLRGNSGGLVEEAVATASVFLDGGPVASYEARGERRELDAAPGGDTATPLVVLVDGGTMSAAELLAGALQDRCRAVLVGSRTFGKGSVQEPSRLADGAVLELTVGRYYTPAGRSPDGTGLTPDVPAPAGDGGAGALALRVLAGLGPRH